ncbi:hypothetical protein GGU10DRAFT_367775 [Lentinula aff. detonsa]|uniref:Uncharacterized protein n=1 Tax=Lentinula aff. detonsa TaxID=2804958 RepID=A0AA38NJ92_9AGAR|nr:hypothetical protein GGU10DRAFT_367775 [Lentinula aff. detonsa]
MASFAVARHCLFRFPRHEGIIRRSIHSSPITWKKKASKLEIEDLFSNEPVEDLLSSDGNPPAPARVEGSSNLKPKQSVPSKHLDLATRHTHFEELYKRVLMQTSSNPKERRKLPPLRNSVWIRLVDLAQNEEELGKVIALVPKWKDMTRHQLGKGGLEEQWGELVVSRAESLSCATLALGMFSNHAKYQVPLSLPAARHLLHALHTQSSLEDVMTAVALYRVYNLTPIAHDLISLGLVCRALVGRIYQPTLAVQTSPSAAPQKGNIQASKEVLDALIQSLRDLVSNTDPSSFYISPHARTRALTPKFSERQKYAEKGFAAMEKEKTWLKWCLKKIEVNLGKSEGFEKIAWLRQWREAAGHVNANHSSPSLTATTMS